MPKDIVYHDEFDDDDNNMYNPIHHCVSIYFGFLWANLYKLCHCRLTIMPWAKGEKFCITSP
jgi:hypothetical protein